jgi:hypothetical protein
MMLDHTEDFGSGPLGGRAFGIKVTSDEHDDEAEETLVDLMS